jgi:hypothetical protein
MYPKNGNYFSNQKFKMDKKRAAYASVDNRSKGLKIVSNTDRHKISYAMKLPSIRDAQSTKNNGESTRSDGRYGMAGYESQLKKEYPNNITSGESYIY